MKVALLTPPKTGFCWRVAYPRWPASSGCRFGCRLSLRDPCRIPSWKIWASLITTDLPTTETHRWWLGLGASFPFMAELLRLVSYCISRFHHSLEECIEVEEIWTDGMVSKPHLRRNYGGVCLKQHVPEENEALMQLFIYQHHGSHMGYRDWPKG